ncbi:MAG: methyltransferase domain-containing protein [Candidatus Hydrogenedentes bacterium]|nr:methyltransferase domain-containing protein [Candidatus Hydrogenedentota bacterium]
MGEKSLAEKPLPRTKRARFQRIILGPVPNLEEHVRPDWWRGVFNSLYLKTDADVVDDQRITKREVDLFADILKLAPDDRVLDLCCGQGRHSLEMARRGFKYVDGVDRSHYLIKRAKGFARKEGLAVRFKEGDARKLSNLSDTFDVVMILGNSFGYFETVQDDLRAVKEVFRVLKPWGRVLIDVADGAYLKEHYQPRSWEWIDKKYFVCRERSTSVDGDRLISREVITHTEKGVIADQFYAERLYTRESVTDLLKAAGFSDIVFHGNITPLSERNQDLGMMEQRMIFTALVRKEWTPIKRKPSEVVRNCVVLMGDPTKPDHLKPSSVFDDDDFYTIDQLKEALREQKGYQFTYLNNHDTLIEDLRKLNGKVDFAFNLCDEGYNNDARKELHVPALLEKLEVPYTGAGPQCLAYCYDKSLARGVAKEMGLPVPEACFVRPGDTSFELPFGFPAIVKPNFGDSSYGITQRSVANNLEELFAAVSEIRDRFIYKGAIIVEEFLTGKDVSVGIIGNPPSSCTVLPVIQEDYSSVPEGLPRLCGYEAKWSPDSPYWNIQSIAADLSEETEKALVDWCLILFERLECRDYARFDWRLDAEGNPKLLDVNPNPGWCWDGHLAKMARLVSISYSDMLGRILRAAVERLNL